MVAGDVPGREILYPVAVVIVVGLVVSTGFNLLVSPVIFWYYGREAMLQTFHRESANDA
jgi:multidrug efflux pump subunit AcrB